MLLYVAHGFYGRNYELCNITIHWSNVLNNYGCTYVFVLFTLGQTDEAEGSSYSVNERGTEWSKSDQVVCMGGLLSG